MTALFISSLMQHKPTGPQRKIFLINTYPLTDEVLKSLDDWPIAGTVAYQQFQNKEAFMSFLFEYRLTLDIHNTTIYEVMTYLGLIYRRSDQWHHPITKEPQRSNCAGHKMYTEKYKNVQTRHETYWFYENHTNCDWRLPNIEAWKHVIAPEDLKEISSVSFHQVPLTDITLGSTGHLYSPSYPSQYDPDRNIIPRHGPIVTA